MNFILFKIDVVPRNFAGSLQLKLLSVGSL